VTAEMLSTTDPRWDDVRTFEAIAADSDWPSKVSTYWRSTVDPRAHKLSHPTAIPGCEGCEPTKCPCGRPECEDPVGHYRAWRGSESSLLASTGHYGRDGSRG
jgi:hypothetical protein